MRSLKCPKQRIDFFVMPSNKKPATSGAARMPPRAFYFYINDIPIAILFIQWNVLLK
jgi:hypothetical protein